MLNAEIGAVLDPDAAQIWTGDFNALTREDYSDDEVSFYVHNENTLKLEHFTKMGQNVVSFKTI